MDDRRVRDRDAELVAAMRANTAARSTRQVKALLNEITANQQAFESAGRSWKRLIPFWLLRTRYRLLKANEPLWDALDYPARAPLNVEYESGWAWTILRLFTGARRV